MTPRAQPSVPECRGADPPAGRGAFTLLEVLVALGILVVGLASVAALLPASGAILGEAGLADRSGTLAANALADLRNRRILTADRFAPPTIPPTVKMVVLGDVFPADPFDNKSPFMKQAATPPMPYELGDDLELGGNNAPVAKTGGVCFGATIVPLAPPAPDGTAPSIGPGTPALVSVAVFRKADSEAKTLTLEARAAGSGIFSVASPVGSAAAQDADRRRFLPACSWVLARSAGDQQPPRWLQIGSSWATRAPGGATPTGAFVAFVDADAAAGLTAGGNTLTVHAFSGLLRVEQRPAVLE